MYTETRRRVCRFGAAAAALTALAVVASACGGGDEVVLGTELDVGIATPEIAATTDDVAQDPADSEEDATAGDATAEDTESPTEDTERPSEDTDPAPEPAEPSAEPTPEPTVPPVVPVSVPDSVSVQLTKMTDVRAPLALVTRSGSPLLYVATKDGLVIAIEVLEQSGSVVETVIDVSSQVLQGDEQGLLGLTFSPDGTRMYLNYTNLDGDTEIVEYRMNGEIADPSTQRLVLAIDQPGIYHNGGHLAFGPDGYLYIGMGDGNSDVAENSQDPTDLLGDVLRIDPLGGEPYAIPGDNPFAERGGAPEIYLTGVRNPWKFSFDRATGDLWIADVGLSTSEEVTVLYASEGRGRGANLGWPLVEGSVPFLGSGPPVDNYVAPIYEYGRSGGCSISGGVVYRGAAIPELYGSFVYGDFCTAQLRAFASSEEQGPLGSFDLGVGYDYGVVAVAEGPDGELYVASFTNEIHRIDPA
ncbi:MAG: PQQ-dependent sugar dehydrogenase [Acidimicrobiales bacterium]